MHPIHTTKVAQASVHSCVTHKLPSLSTYIARKAPQLYQNNITNTSLGVFEENVCVIQNQLYIIGYILYYISDAIFWKSMPSV